MSAIEITISGVIYDKQARTARPVVLIGEATITGLEVGGGPIIPPEQPPIIWGPPGPWPGFPADPGIPGNTPRPPWYPGFPAHPIPPEVSGGPIIPPEPTEPPTGAPDEDGFVKPPPSNGGWAYHSEHGWLYKPGPLAAGPKK